ncbi:MAG TPA: bifunctional phosphopantothenoylcysteine decarboxylase/phosphopantothenate--cysteine ligase CoaBC [Gemmatimonadaceae bacterium]|nr:bifunctional phosphopantothenoylcysteine decarboxylase/phosphopantothenate--cysteine ligase CoaBC [Gemmatimonadaceae bacterium]
MPARPFTGRRVLLGVTGGIASYKTAWLARLLAQAGAEVDVVLTKAAREFVGSITFEALTGRQVFTELVAEGHALDHISLAAAAELVVVAPATADFLARAAGGRSDDLLCAVLLATEAPVLLVPAMNDKMWAHKQTVANTTHLRSLGYAVLDPDEGPLASPQEGAGPGRMPEPETILAHAGRRLEKRGALASRRMLVTAGPTKEPIDPVRFLSNHSSGKMGVAIAAAAWRRGADVTLIAGPLSVPPPAGVHFMSVESTEEMAHAVRVGLATADALVMAAAPADFRAASVATSKVKKANRPDSLVLADAPDILESTRDARRPGSVVVGFALETNDVLAHARHKLAAKELDLMVVNDAREEGAGFGGDTNRVTILAPGVEPQALPLMSKAEVADAILDRMEALFRER